MALTSLICSYSLIIPCLFGIVGLGEKMTLLRGAGFALLCASVFMLRKKDGSMKFEKGWGVCVAVTFVCNGLCSVTQKLHQTAYPGEFCEEFSLVSTLFMTLVLAVVAAVKREKPTLEKMQFALPAGALMGLANYLSLVLSSKLDATVLFPLVTVFTVILNVVASKIVFGDKFTPSQIFGILLGGVSSVLIK